MLKENEESGNQELWSWVHEPKENITLLVTLRTLTQIFFDTETQRGKKDLIVN